MSYIGKCPQCGAETYAKNIHNGVRDLPDDGTPDWVTREWDGTTIIDLGCGHTISRTGWAQAWLETACRYRHDPVNRLPEKAQTDDPYRLWRMDEILANANHVWQRAQQKIAELEAQNLTQARQIAHMSGSDTEGALLYRSVTAYGHGYIYEQAGERHVLDPANVSIMLPQGGPFTLDDAHMVIGNLEQDNRELRDQNETLTRHSKDLNQICHVLAVALGYPTGDDGAITLDPIDLSLKAVDVITEADFRIRRQICAEEGHRYLDVTSINIDYQPGCGRCGKIEYARFKADWTSEKDEQK